jgi:hypothetical protein
MNIKNYTSSVPVSTSITRIEHRLAQAGATHIAKTYLGDKPLGIMFQIPVGNSLMTFKLDAKADKVFDFLIRQRTRPPKPAALSSIKAQAERTAWKNLSDLIDIRMSLIQVDQADTTEMFFSSTYDSESDSTLYEKFKKNGFKRLASPLNQISS